LYGIIKSIERFTAEKDGAQMVIMSEKFGLPSMMPPGYAYHLKSVIREKLPPEYRPDDVDKNFMTWTFVVGSTDPTKMTQENSMFLFALQPDAIRNEMMYDYGINRQEMGEEDWAAMCHVLDEVNRDKRHIVVGEDRLRTLNKKVGDS